MDQQNNGISQTICVYFKIHYVTTFGKSIYITGNTKCLGEWSPT